MIDRVSLSDVLDARLAAAGRRSVTIGPIPVDERDGTLNKKRLDGTLLR
ncbi:MAG: hypothetical protein QNJ88_00655 [Acidimicrobiia bacterium]|nr:hypothetical protein [Acidimicrobiia bacterium]